MDQSNKNGYQSKLASASNAHTAQFDQGSKGPYTSQKALPQGYRSLRNTRQSAGKSRDRTDSRSPGGQTYGRNGMTNGDDDPDYSLSVSELNSNMGNSLLKSGTRGFGVQQIDGMSPESSIPRNSMDRGSTDQRYYQR